MGIDFTVRFTRTWLSAAIGFGFAAIVSSQAAAFDKMYSQDQILKDWPRLKKAVNGIYTKGFRPVFKADERESFRGLEIRFPLPQKGDDLLNFYAMFDQGRPVVVMPVLSLKVMEDVTTAFAWLYEKNYDLSKIEVYFTMTRYRPPEKFSSGRIPSVLKALGVPANALKNPSVDRLSLSLRNEAFAFILAHELGHLHFRHKGYAKITKQQARDDEIQSDKFALDLFHRTATPPLGPFLFFQSQVYRMPHRAEYKTQAEWEKYLRTVSTHPLSTERLQNLSDYALRLANRRAVSERAVWQQTARMLGKFAKFLQDLPTQRCMVRVAREAPIDILRPERAIDSGVALRYCRGVFRQ
ncbi:MAG: hypothetical protein ACR2OV_01425 [Hyphomicrobiaceae bacterium]